MLPHPPAIVRCDGCGHVYWLKDAQKIGELSLGEKCESAAPPEWQQAEFVHEPDEGGYYRAIGRGMARTREEEKEARILAWWKSNEPLRRDLNVMPSGIDVGGRQANLECLISLLDEDEERDRITKAEILRELGRFEEALATLGAVHQGDSPLFARQIERFCKEGDKLVKRIDLDGERAERRPPKRRPWWKFW